MTRDRTADPAAPRRDAPAFEVRQAFWGYVIRRTEGTPILVQVAQGLVLAVAAACLAMALALLRAAPSLVLPLALVTAGLVLLRFAMRGAVVELHLDLARGELREIVSHRVGRSRTGGRLPLDQSVSLHIERTGRPDGLRSLVLHHRGDRDGVCLARGPEPALQALRQRIAHDLRLSGPGGRPRSRAA